MTKIIIGFFIFCIVLFLYLHIQFHLKTSDDLEMYEIEELSKDRFEEICDLRQPVLFDFPSEKIIQTTNKDYILNNYHAFDVKIRNALDTDYNSEIYIPLGLRDACKLFDDDKSGCHYSENNNEFLQETGAIKSMQYNDEYLRPYMVSNCNYDILMASEGTVTPLRYNLNYRNYFMVTQGSVKIKLSPPKNGRYLNSVCDYENFEFRSPVNPWDPQPQFKADFDKVKCLEITVVAGKVIYIPAYWWYSIKFEKGSSISSFYYRTYMNNAAICNHFGMYALQIHNVKRNVVKTVALDSPIPNEGTSLSELPTVDESTEQKKSDI
jgi:hypothetical protein